MQKHKIRKLYPLLKILNKLSDEERQILICYLTHDGCAGIYECIHNAIFNVTLPKNQRQKIQKELQKDKGKFRRLFDDDLSLEKKHKTLRKVGGGVGIVLQTVLPLLEKYIAEK
jgi:hypothetical protein